MLIKQHPDSTLTVIELPFAAPPILACGAWLKNTICLTYDQFAYISPSSGDLSTVLTRNLFVESIARLTQSLCKPEIIVHDLHPDFYNTQFAHRYAIQHNLPTISVQHHHAHIAALCAEHSITHAVIGIALDGIGLGTDNMAWGGELLYAEGAHFKRLGHLQPLAMPGGDRAAREPWRMAAAVLFHLGRTDEIFQRFSDQPAVSTVVTMLRQKLNSPMTSSMGRLFDAAAGLLGIDPIQSYEAQAARRLQALATEYSGTYSPLAYGYRISNNVLDFSPLLAWLIDQNNKHYAAAIFHATLAMGLAEWAILAAKQYNVLYVALGGGCFHNALLHQTLSNLLTARGMQVLSATRLAPDDSAISLGQAWIATHNIMTHKNHAYT
jgi:hydrogenase maturation protein HypF